MLETYTTSRVEGLSERFETMREVCELFLREYELLAKQNDHLHSKVEELVSHSPYVAHVSRHALTPHLRYLGRATGAVYP